MNDVWEVVTGDVSVRDGRIDAVGIAPHDTERYDTVVDGTGCALIPGLIQTHIHLCQTLFRGAADDLALLDWLRTRIWPMEAAHRPTSLRAAARLAVAELLLSGTTSVLTMETTHDTHSVFEALEGTGIRATVGKCLMDDDALAPARLRQPCAEGIDESLALHRRWHAEGAGLLRAALAPRFAVSCSETLLEAVGATSRETGMLVHTHASESRDEVAEVRRRTGLSNVEYFSHLGLATSRLCLAHCVWAEPSEQQMMATADVKVMHCPGSNLKLGSGVAPITEMRTQGICVSLGADGAACNNRLDMFDEMRLAATLQAMRHGPGALSARETLWMATRAGARTLGLEDQIGSIASGKRADLVLVDLTRLHHAPGTDPYSTLVYAARGTDVRLTMVDGEIVVRDGQLVHLDAAAIASSARAESRALLARAGI